MEDLEGVPPRLIDRVPQVGRVEWIGVRPERRAPVVPVRSAMAHLGKGLDGDRRMQSERPSKREITLIQAEHLPVIAAIAGLKTIDPATLRRNLVVSGVNLTSLKRGKFRVGEAVLEWTGSCDPCSRMEEALGAGGFQAMRGHGGITARIIDPGAVAVGDLVAKLLE